MVTQKNVKLPRIIVALDFPTIEQADNLLQLIKPQQCQIKIGLELFTVAGPDYVKKVINRGFSVFLDLKFHDIPNTVSKACSSIINLGVNMLTVHTLGGSQMLKAASDRVNMSRNSPILLGVTLLTSHSEKNINQDLGLPGSVGEQVGRLARMAYDNGLPGIVCSAQEASMIKKNISSDIICVCPGIRLNTTDSDDQQRIMTPKQAMDNGADYIVIGRSITKADDPKAVIEQIAQQIVV